MLNKEDNETLCRVGPGTLMGNLLRRYWTPALLSVEVPEPDSPPVRVRLLGEDMVAFRDSDGRVGLVTQACPHRGASLFFGRNEEAGLRCVYHGWKFDTTGACVDMPSEPSESNFKSKVRVNAYATHESGGIVWTYMGPKETMTPFRDFGSDALPQEQWRANKLFVDCNWVQSMEGNLDTSHISWLHQFHAAPDFPDDGTDAPGYPTNPTSIRIWAHDRAPRLEVQDDWYGFRYAGLRTTPNGYTHVRMTAYVLPYTTFVATVPVGTGGGMFVPIDDYTTWRYNYGVVQPQLTHRPETGGNLFGIMPYVFGVGQPGIQKRDWVASNDYLIDRDVQKGTTFTGIPEFVSQDMAVTESMGAIYDRTQEHLGTTDKSVIRMRTLLLKSARDLANGIAPPATDPSLPYNRIFSAEKVLAPGEDWRDLGTDKDPIFADVPRGEKVAVETSAGD
jgi:nitrite reductase/ring-hydroxylating ferredoxin subunit